MARILITEELAPRSLEVLREAGHDVDVQLDLTPETLLSAIDGAHALIIRSATTVTSEVLDAGKDLVVVGRAGVGLDNVDVQAATTRGVMVVNAPMSNIVSAAEQAMALLLSSARNTPQAHAALKQGKWQRSKWEGVELLGKTLGVVGLGRIGALVAQRAAAFGMRLVAYDPYVTPERARQIGAELMTLEECVAQSDFITIHLPKTPETSNLFDEKLLAKTKAGARIINAARGGIINEQALADAIASGHIAGAGIDVWAKEPTTESPLFALDSVVVSPHLGASTVEAQDKAGVAIAEQLLLALAGEFVPFAVNVSASEANETVRPFLPLAELLGTLFASLCNGVQQTVDVAYEGAIAEYDTRILTLAVMRGLFTGATDEQVTYVNAPQLAKERGVEVRETKTQVAQDYVNLITLRTPEHSLAATLVGTKGDVRITMVDDHDVETKPAANLLVVRNDDRAGMIGIVGTMLGEAGVSIKNMAVGQSPAGKTALMVIATDRAAATELIEQLESQEGILSVHTLAG